MQKTVVNDNLRRFTMKKEKENEAIPSADGVKCPKCGSTDLEIVSDVQGEGAKFWKLCLCGLLGLCGAGKTTTTHYWVCKHCGNKFKI